MADDGIFATTLEVIRKAGVNANSTATASEALTNDYVAQAESEINVATRYNWSDAYAGLNEDNRDILKEAASNHAAINIINYDMSGFTSRGEAESMITVLRDAYLRAISILRTVASQTYLGV